MLDPRRDIKSSLGIATLPQTAGPGTVILLRDITNIQWSNFKPYCLLLQATGKKYYLAFKSNEEYNGWHDAISSCAISVHQVQDRLDPVLGTFTVSSSWSWVDNTDHQIRCTGHTRKVAQSPTQTRTRAHPRRGHWKPTRCPRCPRIIRTRRLPKRNGRIGRPHGP